MIRCETNRCNVSQRKTSSLTAAVVLVLTAWSLTGCNQGQQRVERGQQRWDGSMALQQHDYLKALEAYNQLIAQQPERGEHYLGRARAHVGLSKYQEADDDFSKAAQLKFDCLNERGRVRLLLGKPEEAAHDLQAFLDAKPALPGLDDAMYATVAWKLAGKPKDADAVAARAMNNYAHDSYVVAHKNDRNATKYVWQKWPYPALQYLHGDIPAEKMLSTTADNEWNAVEARGVIGLNLQATGKAGDAAREFEYVLQHAKGDRFVAQLATAMLVDAGSSEQRSTK